MFELDDLQAQAKQIDDTYQRDVAELSKRTDLTMEGKVLQARDLDGRRRAAVTRLQEQARDRHAAAMERAQRDAQAARAADVERKRAILGDVVMLRLYERKVDAADAGELLAMIEEASPGYEKELLTELSRATLYERTSTPAATRADVDAYRELSPPPAVDYELRQAGQRIEQLDLVAHRQGMADRLGLSAAHVPDPF